MYSLFYLCSSLMHILFSLLLIYFALQQHSYNTMPAKWALANYPLYTAWEQIKSTNHALRNRWGRREEKGEMRGEKREQRSWMVWKFFKLSKKLWSFTPEGSLALKSQCGTFWRCDIMVSIFSREGNVDVHLAAQSICIAFNRVASVVQFEVRQWKLTLSNPLSIKE